MPPTIEQIQTVSRYIIIQLSAVIRVILLKHLHNKNPIAWPRGRDMKVSFVSLNSDLSVASVTAVLRAISYHKEPIPLLRHQLHIANCQARSVCNLTSVLWIKLCRSSNTVCNHLLRTEMLRSHHFYIMYPISLLLWCVWNHWENR